MWESIGGQQLPVWRVARIAEMYNDLIPKLAVFRYGMQGTAREAYSDLGGRRVHFRKISGKRQNGLLTTDKLPEGSHNHFINWQITWDSGAYPMP